MTTQPAQRGGGGAFEKAWDVQVSVSEPIHTRTVDMHVRRLRAKLGETGAWIQTIRGFGYRLKVPEGVQ